MDYLEDSGAVRTIFSPRACKVIIASEPVAEIAGMDRTNGIDCLVHSQMSSCQPFPLSCGSCLRQCRSTRCLAIDSSPGVAAAVPNSYLP